MNLRLWTGILVCCALATGGCSSMVSKFAESPVPDGLQDHPSPGLVLHSDLHATEVAVLSDFIRGARAECDRLFHTQVPGDLDVYIFRHTEDASGRWRYAVSLPTGAIHIGYHYALRRGAPPLRAEDLENGILGDTLRHEISHQHLYRILGRLPRQPWVYEGLPMLVETLRLHPGANELRTRPARATYLEVARWLENGLCLLPDHVFDMGWQDFYDYAQYGTYSVAETVVDLLHAEAGRPADLAAFCRDIVARHNRGLLPDPGFRERWRNHVLTMAERQVADLTRDLQDGSPYERIAAFEQLNYTLADPRWGDGRSLMRQALVANLQHADRGIQARTFPAALDFVTGEIDLTQDSADDLRVPMANFLRDHHPEVQDLLLKHWLERLQEIGPRFWDNRTVGTLGWTLESGDPQIRLAGLPAIARCGGREFLAPLMAHLRDDDPEFVRLALFAVAGIGRERAIPVLQPCLAAADPHLRNGAAIALAELRVPEARERVRALAVDPTFGHRDWAWRALSRYPDVATVTFLEQEIQRQSAPEELGPLRALAWIDTAEARAALRRLFEIEPLRARVAEEMLGTGNSEWVTFLGGRLADLPHPPHTLLWLAPDATIRAHAAALVALAQELRAAGSVLESFLVRQRLRKAGMRVPDGPALLESLADFDDVGWTHEQEILAQLAAEFDPRATLELLIRRLHGNLASRRGAIECLRALTGLTHDFHFVAPNRFRQAAIATWQSWFREHAARLEFHAEDGTVRVRQ